MHASSTVSVLGRRSLGMISGNYLYTRLFGLGIERGGAHDNRKMNTTWAGRCGSEGVVAHGAWSRQRRLGLAWEAELS